MRPVDADEAKRIAREYLTDPYHVISAVAVLDKTPTITPPNEWVSVEERLPEESDGMVLLTDGISVRTGYRNWMFRMDDYPIVFVPGQKKGGGEMAVTHWMKISAPPDRRPPEGEA